MTRTAAPIKWGMGRRGSAGKVGDRMGREGRGGGVPEGGGKVGGGDAGGTGAEQGG